MGSWLVWRRWIWVAGGYEGEGVGAGEGWGLGWVGHGWVGGAEERSRGG